MNPCSAPLKGFEAPAAMCAKVCVHDQVPTLCALW